MIYLCFWNQKFKIMEKLKSILEQFGSNREKSIHCVDWEQKNDEEKSAE